MQIRGVFQTQTREALASVTRGELAIATLRGLLMRSRAVRSHQ